MSTSATTRKTVDEIERWLDYQSAGVLEHPVDMVWFRCGECRKERRRQQIIPDRGQLIGTARRDPNGVWWWFRRHLASTAGEGHRLILPLEHTGVFADMDSDDFGVPLDLRCRVARHHRPPRDRAWLRSRAEDALADGYQMVHV